MDGELNRIITTYATVTVTYLVGGCVGVTVQKSRLYGYVETDTIRTIEDSDYSKSGFVREAVLEKIDREGLDDE